MQLPLGGPGAGPAKLLSFRLTDVELDELDEASKRVGRPRSELIRVAIREHLARLGDNEVMPQAS